MSLYNDFPFTNTIIKLFIYSSHLELYEYTSRIWDKSDFENIIPFKIIILTTKCQ